ncbi:MAG: sugar transferase, partial [Candidatus Hodarchaeota archaeon]
MILKRLSKREFILFIGDISIIIFSINLAFIIRVKKLTIHYLGFNKGLATILILLVSYLISYYIFNFYNIREKFRTIQFLPNIFGALILVSLLSIIFFYVFPFMVGRGVFLISLIIIGILTTAWRFIYSIFFNLKLPTKKILLVGKREPAKIIYSLIEKNPDYEIVEVLGDVLNKKNSLEKMLNDYHIDDIIILIDPTHNKKLNKILIDCRMKGINIWDVPSFYEHFINKLPVKYIKDQWLIFTAGFERLGSSIYRRTKRAIDLAISSVIFITALPLGIIAALAIKLSSRGPIFFAQERVGKNQKPFKIFKFRTMISDAEKRTPMWAEENDMRITRVGRILRKTRFDEIPQLINVIKGEMSLIGPRPGREFFVKKLTEKIPFYSLRFSVKPGLTGWAQIIYKYGSSEEDALEKLQYELYYVKN